MKNKKVIARVTDFAYGLRDRAPHTSKIPSGNYISIDRHFLSHFLKSHNLQLAYVIKYSYSMREYSYSDEMKTATTYDIIING